MISIAVIIAAVGVIGVIVFGINGLFYKPSAVEKVMGPYHFAYEDFVGPYSKTYPVFNRVYKLLTDNNILNTIGIGIYHDDPSKVASEKLRSSCGSVISESDMDKAASLGLKTGILEKKESIVVEFPVKSSLSYMLAPSKCYPVLAKYIEEKGYEMTAPYEIYDIPGKKMYVVMNITK